MRGASLLWLAWAAGCAGTYRFPVEAATMRIPSSGEVERSAAVAADGHSRHALIAFSREEACFRSTLDGTSRDEAQAMQFRLVGFHDREQKLSQAPAIPSTRTLIEASERRVQLTSGDPLVHDVGVVRICFEKPTTVLGPDTAYLVLDVPKKSGGKQDGVWKLTR